MTEENNVQNENTEMVEATEVEQLQQQVEELQDRYLRVQAELANIQKRNAKERQDAAKYRSQNLATELLPVIDNIERALEIEVEDEKAVNFKKGVEMVYNLMLEALKNEKIEAINPINEPFDPNYHMSIQVQEAEEGQEADTVINVVQKGYKLDERVLRPAMVIVAQ
ncbi:MULTISPECIES: nucleotide exchange factor GrpE [unclassified Jeotgalibaca]|uniref:nucleotide exchange factor GrpE n=1 Tax=unclassified Jeotgalibaca TaxID=2621505 RepID=UPI003FD5DDD6